MSVTSPLSTLLRGRRQGRPWTRLATLATVTHVFYELAAGVGMPLASLVGPVPAATGFTVGGGVALRESSRQPASWDRRFALLNGFYLSAVIGHFSAWPRKRVGVLPWLTECEGLSGRLMPGYNLILYVSALSAVGGWLENRGRLQGILLPVVLVPTMVHVQRHEYLRLRAQARRRRGWWNRRLQDR
jgi:hypothetical protein